MGGVLAMGLFRPSWFLSCEVTSDPSVNLELDRATQVFRSRASSECIGCCRYIERQRCLARCARQSS